MIFERDSKNLNAIYIHAVERRERHRLSYENYESLDQFFRVPVLISGSISTTITALNLTGGWFPVITPFLAVTNTVLNGIPFVFNFKGKVESHKKSCEAYSQVVNFLSCEYALNKDRKADFYPSAPAIAHGANFSVPIPTEDEYVAYFYDELYRLLNVADDEADIFPSNIDKKVIQVENLITT